MNGFWDFGHADVEVDGAEELSLGLTTLCKVSFTHTFTVQAYMGAIAKGLFARRRTGCCCYDVAPMSCYAMLNALMQNDLIFMLQC